MRTAINKAPINKAPINKAPINKAPINKAPINKAPQGKHSEYREEYNGQEYQFMISRTESEGKTTGVVILCFDVSETAFAERNRKEFTANVSHELKTPFGAITILNII